ncbi:MAG: carbamoyl-phosphate synthase (glutamine-hydrolyzing) large subunit [Candidatus Odinarchaeia archaeon]
MPKYEWIKKTLILGSGAIRIGQAGEFDYSGSQALKALREEGIETILINPNIATIQTDPKLAGKVYLLPLTVEYVEKVIQKEKPDSILLSFGGQTGLNLGVELYERGILDKYNVKVIGTPIDAIQKTEDRELFKQTMKEAGVEVLKSKTANTVDEAVEIAENEIGYPVIIRVAYTLGGRGSGVAHNRKELVEIAQRGLKQSRIHQILVEEYVGGWKEIEYEVVRDASDNCITVCNMENFDPMGIHTGESIVISPSQTLNNKEYHLLRDASIRAVRTVGVIGECNIQYALDPKSESFRAIEINARLSRSSALASKATGYPLAYIAAKLAIGYTLPELLNKVTHKTTACFEPALDYVTVKIPRWDLQKFPKVDHQLGPQMKSVGEVMAIGRTFEEALQKAARMIDIGKLGLVANKDDENFEKDLEYALSHPTDERLFDIVRAFKKGFTVDKIYELTKIDKWFLNKIKNIIDIELELKKYSDSDIKDLEQLNEFIRLLKKAKQSGFSDKQIAVILGVDELTIRQIRKGKNIIPFVKQIDTLAAEWPAKTNYLYLTYNAEEDDLDFTPIKGDKIIVLGSGTYRIGSSVEFDWCGVNMVWSLKKLGIEEVIMVNCNPETVSTDYDVSDKLYFEELSFERVLDIYEKENPRGVIVSVGGQAPNNIAYKLHEAGVKILGTSAVDIDRAEDRAKFSALLDKLNIPQPKWETLTSLKEAKDFCRKVGYPVLIRPSYVLSGAAMRVAYTEQQLDEFLRLATDVSPEHPVVISKFIEDAMEVEVDGVCDGKNTLIGAVVEHIELAGIHSGDATMIIPPQTISPSVESMIIHYTRKIASSLNIKGPFNIQYLVKGHDVLVIECNLRASRSMPFVSKIRGINLMTVAASVILGNKINDIWFDDYTYPKYPKYIGVKVPQFSFMRLKGADPVLGVEMMSTGEVACMGETFSDAFIKALMAAEMKIPLDKGSVLFTVGGVELKNKILPIAKGFQELGFKIYATEHTAEALRDAGINAITLYKIREYARKPNILDYIVERKLDLVINIPQTTTMEKYVEMLKDEYDIRCKSVEFNIPVITNLKLTAALVEALKKIKYEELTAVSLNDYMDSLPMKLW